MARIALTPVDNVHRPPNTGDGTEFGVPYKTLVDNLNTMMTEIYAGIQNAGGVAIRPAGNINVQAVSIGSSGTNTTQTLATYSLPGGSLANVGQEVIVTAWGRCGATGSPGVQMVLGGATSSFSQASHVSNHWYFEGIMTKTAANAQNDVFFTSVGPTTGAAAVVGQLSATDTSTDGSAITLAVTMKDAAAVQSSVIIDGFTVEFFS
jgi:hypothetical protein